MQAFWTLIDHYGSALLLFLIVCVMLWFIVWRFDKTPYPQVIHPRRKRINVCVCEYALFHGGPKSLGIHIADEDAVGVVLDRNGKIIENLYYLDFVSSLGCFNFDPTEIDDADV